MSNSNYLEGKNELRNLSYRMGRWEIAEYLKENKGSWVDICHDEQKTHSNILLVFHPSMEEKVFCRVDTTYNKAEALDALKEIIDDLKYTY